MSTMPPVDRLKGAACQTPDGALVDWFFPDLEADGDNHGARGKLVCAGCPARAACLLGALGRNEEFGIWGGAGEARRRTLRRARAEGRLDDVLAAHWRNLDGAPEPGDAELLAVFGEGATHGKPGTYAKGCRCDPCVLAASLRTAQAKLTHRPRRSS